MPATRTMWPKWPQRCVKAAAAARRAREDRETIGKLGRAPLACAMLIGSATPDDPAIEREFRMMSLKRVFYVALVSMGACGEKSKPIDFTNYVPKVSEHIAHVEAPTPHERIQVVTPPVVADAAVPTTFEDALAQGRALLHKGDTASAKSMLEAAVQLDGNRAEPHIELARLYISTGERSRAMAAANRAVKLAPQSSLAWNTKGRAELHRFSYDDAVEAFSNAIELNPDNVWAWNNLGYTELLLKRYEEAAQHLVEATSRPGATGYMFNNLGTALEQLDRLDEARAAFEAGGQLGSNEALASRKRLEGVQSVAMFLPHGKPDLIDSERDDESGHLEVNYHDHELDDDGGLPHDNPAQPFEEAAAE